MESLPAIIEPPHNSLDLLFKVSKEFTSGSDLRDVLIRVLRLSLQHIGAISGSIVVLDDEKQPLETAFLMPGRTPDSRLVQLNVTYNYGLAGWVGRNEQPVLIDDTHRDQRWLQRPDDDIECTGSKSAISVPIMTREKTIGVITLVHSTPGFFTKAHLKLVQSIADQVSLVILNARLNLVWQRQMMMEEAWRECAFAVSESVNLDDVFSIILKQISQALNTEYVTISLLNDASKELEIKAVYSDAQKDLFGKKTPVGIGITGWVAQNGQGLIISDVSLDHRYSSGIDATYDDNLPPQALICAPIRFDGNVVGVITASAPAPAFFDQLHLKMIEGIGAIIGAAIRQTQILHASLDAQQRYLELFENSVDPILLTDEKGKIHRANPQARKIIGMTARRLKSTRIEKILELEFDTDLRQLVDQNPQHLECTLISQSKGRIPVEAYVSNIPGNPPQLQWILRDFSDRKDLDQVREDLIEMVYHDLRSPLSNVVSSLEALNGMMVGDQTADSLLKIALRSTEQVQRLTNSLLEINRLESEKKIGSRKQVQASTVLDFGISAVYLLTIEKQIQILTELENGLNDLWVDEDMIRRVMINLLENAVKFTPSKGKIWVGAKRMDEMILFWVRDSGPGISLPNQNKIFEKFVRLQTQGPSRGLGLGLAFCRLAVQAHDGEIWVESRPGEGACFKFTLPIIPLEPSSASAYPENAMSLEDR